MSIEELRAEVEECIQDCLHHPSSDVEHILLLSKCILLLTDTVAAAAATIDQALADLPGGRP